MTLSWPFFIGVITVKRPNFVRLFLFFTVLFLFVGTVSASPASEQVFFESIYLWGTSGGETNEVLTLFENGTWYAIDVREDSSIEAYTPDQWGEFSPFGAYGGSAEHSRDAAVGDFNGDGNKDVAVCNANAQNQIWLGAGDGTFTFGQDFGTVGNQCSGIDAAQADGVNGDDVVVANSNDQLEVWLTDATGLMATRLPYGSATGYNDVAFGVMKNGAVATAQDFFAVSDSGEELWANSGTGTFSLDTIQISLTRSGRKVVVEDIDLDGRDDVLVAGLISHGYHNQGDLLGTYIIPSFEHDANDVLVVNFDEEAGPEVLLVQDNQTTVYGGPELNWYSGMTLSGGDAIAAIDVDDDSDLDIVIGVNGGYNKVFKNGLVRTAVLFQETAVVGSAEIGSVASQLLHINFLGNGRRLVSIQPLESWVTTTETLIDQAPTFMSIGFFVDMDATGLTSGEKNSFIEFKTNDPANEVVRMPVTFTVTAAELTVDPVSITATMSTIDTAPLLVPVRITNVGTASTYVKITENVSWISTPTDWILLEPGGSTVIEVSLLKSATAGEFTTSLVVQSNDAYLAGISIPVTLTVTGYGIFLPLIVRP